MTTHTHFPLLERVDSPADLRTLPVAQLAVLAAEARRFLIESVSETGGHLAANLGTVELEGVEAEDALERGIDIGRARFARAGGGGGRRLLATGYRLLTTGYCCGYRRTRALPSQMLQTCSSSAGAKSMCPPSVDQA